MVKIWMMLAMLFAGNAYATVPQLYIMPCVGAGTGVIEGYNAVWLVGRNLVTGTGSATSELRSDHSSEGGAFYARRAFVSFAGTLPAGATIDSASICGEVGYEIGSYTISCCAGTFTGNLATSWYTSFTGWGASDAYTPTLTGLQQIASTSFATGDTLRFTVSSAGKTSIAAGSLKVVFLISNDINGTPAPGSSADIGTRFTVGSTHIKVYCQVPSSAVFRNTLSSNGISTPLKSNGIASPLK